VYPVTRAYLTARYTFVTSVELLLVGPTPREVRLIVVAEHRAEYFPDQAKVYVECELDEVCLIWYSDE
jgi:hypothetical protein